MVAHIFTRPQTRARTATPLLAFIAGDFADAIAQAWPAPHGEFFALPAARRHAAAIALAGLARREMAPRELRRMVEFARDAVVAEALAGEFAQGLMRALAKAGERLWEHRDYRTFLGLLAEPMGAEVLRHLDEVRPVVFAPIAALPPALRLATIVRVLPSQAAATDLARAFHIAVRMRQPDAAARIARRWSAGGDLRAVFARAQEDLTPDAFRASGSGAGAGRSLRACRPAANSWSRSRSSSATALRIMQRASPKAAWPSTPGVSNPPLRSPSTGTPPAGASPRRKRPTMSTSTKSSFASWSVVSRRGASAPVRRCRTLTSRLDDYASGTSYISPLGASFVEQLALGDLWT